MIKVILTILVFSTLNEFLPIPGIELNQFIILTLIPFVFILAKGRKLNKIKKNMILILFGLWIYITLQGLLMTYDYTEYLKVIKNYSISFIFIIIVVHLDVLEYKLILRKFTAFCNVFFMFEFILGYLNLDNIYSFFFNPYFADLRHMGNFLSPNSYGIVIDFIIISNTYLFFQYKKRGNLIFAILLTMPLFTTISRSAIIILLIGFGIFAYIKFRIEVKVGLVLTFLLGLNYIVSDRMIVWLSQYSDSYFIRRFILYLESDSLFGDRAIEYETIFSIYKQSWFTGLGFSNISGSNELYHGMSSMHNEYFRFLIEGGIVGGILFSIIIGFVVYSLVRLLRTKNIDRNVQAVITSFTAMFLISELQYNFFNAHREGILLIFFGFSALSIFVEHQSDKLQRQAKVLVSPLMSSCANITVGESRSRETTIVQE